MSEIGQRQETGFARWNSALFDDVRALFREAHLRRRRRRRWLAALAVMLAAITVAGTLTWVNRPPGQHGAGGRVAGGAPGTDGRGAADQAGPAPAAVIWVDNASRLHVGVIGSRGLLGQRVAGEANAASEPLVAIGRRIYWVDPAGAYVISLGHWSQVVRTLNLRTGRITVAGAGQTVFLSADRRYLLMSQTPASLTQIRVGGGKPRVLNVPRGWYLPGGDGTADPLNGQGLDTANGILVQSMRMPGIGARRIAIWNPQTGTVTAIGLARAVIDAYTPPGAGYSLLAWLPARCPRPMAPPPGSCRVDITNTASGAVMAVHSPSAGGFAVGGAFAPAGRSLAVFVNAPSRRSARLALIDTATGAIRVVTAVAFPLGMDYGWARWLPDGSRLIAGTGSGGYLINAATRGVRPLRVPRGHGAGSMNYTAAVVQGAARRTNS